MTAMSVAPCPQGYAGDMAERSEPSQLRRRFAASRGWKGLVAAAVLVALVGLLRGDVSGIESLIGLDGVLSPAEPAPGTDSPGTGSALLILLGLVTLPAGILSLVIGLNRVVPIMTVAGVALLVVTIALFWLSWTLLRDAQQPTC